MSKILVDFKNSLESSDIQLLGYIYAPEVISASGDNAVTGEGMDKAFDANTQTKWLTFADSGWITYRFDAPFKANMYSLTSANDYSGRNPKNWYLYGSNDNSTWVLLDKRKDQTFAGYFSKNVYSFNNTHSYLYYKLDVESTVSDPVLQLSELEFYSIYAGSENLPNEGIDKAFDNDSQTKWLCFKNSETLQIQFMRPYTITKYALTSANDASDRNPKRWRVWASNGSWPRIQLDERAAQNFTDYFQRKEYDITNTTPYTHYQLEITENNGGGITQLAELEFLQ